ncbi:hypothetical protein HDU98_000445 [Podochytrium sp. JEL0797]|nr:hypothetical protein HDU98_000445 [Podochytrium sp. JEL0797]
MSVVSPPPPFDATSTDNNTNSNEASAPPPPATANAHVGDPAPPPLAKPAPEDNHKSPPVSPHDPTLSSQHSTKQDTLASKDNILLATRRSSNPPQTVPSATITNPAPQHPAKQLKQSTPASSAANNTPATATPPVKLHEVVFVDPDEPDAPWWWPAIVVPQKEFSEFRKSVNIEIKDPEATEYLVCYFEDGSFSTIPKDDAMPFHPRRHPYTTYLQSPDGPRFRLDNAVSLATDYFENGVVPPSFLWLNGGYLPAPGSMPGALGFAGGVNGDVVGGVMGGGQQVVLPSPATGGKKRTQGDKRSSNASRKEAGQGGAGDGKKKSRREHGAGGAGSGGGEKDKSRKASPPSTINTNRSKHPTTTTTTPMPSKKSHPNNPSPHPHHTHHTHHPPAPPARDNSSLEPSPGPLHHPQHAHTQHQTTPSAQSSRKSSNAALFGSMYTGKRGGKSSQSGDVGLGIKTAGSSTTTGGGSNTHAVVSPHRSTQQQLLQQGYRPTPLPTSRQQQQPPPPHQIIVGSSGYTTGTSSMVCGVCGKVMGTCACSGNGGVGGQVLQHFQPPQQQQQQDVHQVGALQYSSASLHAAPAPAGRPGTNTTTMGYYTHRPVVASFEGASASAGSASAGGGVVNPFAPICVLKRSERPEFVMLRELVPVGRRRVVKGVVGRVVRGGGVHK